jgi:hypothetical protein
VDVDLGTVPGLDYCLKQWYICRESWSKKREREENVEIKRFLYFLCEAWALGKSIRLRVIINIIIIIVTCVNMMIFWHVHCTK